MNVKTLKLMFVIFIIFHILWWVKINLLNLAGESEAYYFNISYGVASLLGGIAGIYIANRWGGFRGYLGKALTFFSLALIVEALAVFTWSGYNIFLGEETPYPSLADIFYLSVIPIFSAAMFYLIKSTGTVEKITPTLIGKSILVPMVLLGISYYLFLYANISFEDRFKAVFDLGYPIGYSITLALGALALLTVGKYEGGILRKPTTYMVLSSVLLFVADYGFLYTLSNETYVNGGFVDLLYSLALPLISISLLKFHEAIQSVGSISKQLSDHQYIQANPNVGSNFYINVIVNIIKDQEKIVGPLAYYEAKGIKGIQVSEDLSNITVSEDPVQVVNALVNNYKTLFGNAAVNIMKESINKVIKENPQIKEVNINIKL